MKRVNSLKTLRNRYADCQLVRRGKRVVVLCKSKARGKVKQ